MDVALYETKQRNSSSEKKKIEIEFSVTLMLQLLFGYLFQTFLQLQFQSLQINLFLTFSKSAVNGRGGNRMGGLSISVIDDFH